MVLWIFQVALRLRDRHDFIWQLTEILKFSILTPWNKYSEKRKYFSKNWSNDIKLKKLRLKAQHFHAKSLCQKPILGKTDLGVQNGPIAKNSFASNYFIFLKNVVSA